MPMFFSPITISFVCLSRKCFRPHIQYLLLLWRPITTSVCTLRHTSFNWTNYKFCLIEVENTYTGNAVNRQPSQHKTCPTPPASYLVIYMIKNKMQPADLVHVWNGDVVRANTVSSVNIYIYLCTLHTRGRSLKNQTTITKCESTKVITAFVLSEMLVGPLSVSCVYVRAQNARLIIALLTFALIESQK